MGKESAFTMYKLLNIVGCPAWFQRTQWRKDKFGETNLVVLTNSKPPIEDLNRIPTKIDNIVVRIIYRKNNRL